MTDSAHPAPLGLPPPSLSSQPLPLITLGDSAVLCRIIPTTAIASGNLLRCSTEDGRFSGSLSPYPVLYCGGNELAAFSERCVRRTSFPGGYVTFSASGGFINTRTSLEIAIEAPLTLVDLASPALLSIGATRLIDTTDHYEVTQQWAAAFHEHPSSPHGLLYNSHLCNQPCAALFEEALPRIRVRAHRALSHTDLAVIDYLNTLGIALV